MMTSELAREAQQAITLIKSFSLELEQYSPESQVLYWLNHYRAAWIRDAIIEAVYQGRYKIISVAHLLDLWKRRGQPVCHFTSGFEQVISAQLGTPVHLSPSMMAHSTKPMGTFSNGSEVSPLRPSKEELSTASKVAAHASPMMNYGNYPSLSIDAFPVEDENALVEVYQAGVPHKQLADNPSSALEASNTKIEKISHTSDYVLAGKSLPIQPFRPTRHQQHLSKR